MGVLQALQSDFPCFSSKEMILSKSNETAFLEPIVALN